MPASKRTYSTSVTTDHETEYKHQQPNNNSQEPCSKYQRFKMAVKILAKRSRDQIETQQQQPNQDDEKQLPIAKYARHRWLERGQKLSGNKRRLELDMEADEQEQQEDAANQNTAKRICEFDRDYPNFPPLPQKLLTEEEQLDMLVEEMVQKYGEEAFEHWISCLQEPSQNLLNDCKYYFRDSVF